MNKQSNAYIITYTVILTVVCAFLLAMASEGLKPFKEANIAYDLKKNILLTTMSLEGKKKPEVEDLYQKLVQDKFVVDAKGNKVEVDIETINVQEEYRKDDINERLLPVYVVNDQEDASKKYYVFPMYGFGLWDYIWGYVALEPDYNTIKGTVFLHKGETPGLGARIANAEVQARFEGKKVFNGEELQVVQMQKGEGNDYSENPYQVDGMSGATITGDGLNDMLKAYFKVYKSFIEAQKQGTVSMAN